MLVKALIHLFVSTSNLTEKKSPLLLENREVTAFIVDGKPLDRPEFKENKNFQQPTTPPRSHELTSYVMRKDLGMTEEQVWTALVSFVTWCTQCSL